MLKGDFSTMPLAEVLQWIDFSGRAGLLTLLRDERSTWLRLAAREVVEVSPPPDAAEVIAKLKPEAASEPWLKLPPQVLAEERMLDLFLSDGGDFGFEGVKDPHSFADVLNESTPDPTNVEGAGVALELPIRQLVHEGMRHRDEWPAIDEAYPNEGALLLVGAKAEPAGLGALGRILLRCASRKLTLGEIRVSFGLSRPALLRRVHELVRLDILKVEGTEVGHDPVGQLTAKAMQLAAAHQYDEARHVLETVLSTDPSDPRLRALLEDVSSRQLSQLREEFESSAQISHISLPSREEAAGLTATERELYEKIEDDMQIDHLVMQSKLRELETLRTLEKMSHLGLIRVTSQEG